jgi:hypothetical protein
VAASPFAAVIKGPISSIEVQVSAGDKEHKDLPNRPGCGVELVPDAGRRVFVNAIEEGLE